MVNIVPLISTPVSSFERDCFLKRPALIRGLAQAMPAFSKWTDAYLKSAFGGLTHFATLQDGRRARMKLSTYVDYLLKPQDYSTSEGPLYMTDVYLRPSVLSPELDVLEMDARCPLPRRGKWAERVAIYMGTPGTATGLHTDIYDTQSWMAQLRGEKEWRLCRPETKWCGKKKPIDLFESSDLDVPIFDVTLTPGDVLYVPGGWWHQVRNRTSNMAIAGHFFSVQQARASLHEARHSPNPQTRAEWPPLLEMILALDGN